MSALFTPYTLKQVELKNRIVMAPMCLFASGEQENGQVTNFHKLHYGARAVGQVGLILIEATAVSSQGRISAKDLGIWSDEQAASLRELTDLVHEQGSKIGIQLAHAGRKAEIDGDILAPSPLAFDDKSKTPQEMTLSQIRETVLAFGAAAARAKEAGFDVIELHAAHGYLLNQFLSPLTNLRTDEYGGTREKRFHLLRDVIGAVQAAWDGPLLVRISANEYHADGNQSDDFIWYAKQMKELGIDLIDVSSGGVVPAQIDVFPGYQIPYAQSIKHGANMATGAVGLITSGLQAEEIITNEQADLVIVGRVLLRDPYWPRTAAKELGIEIEAPGVYRAGW